MMRLRNILGTCLIGCGVCVALTSCLKDQEDYFDKSASERLQSTMDEVKQILRSSEYGWELEYYPSTTLAYGGVVYTVKFDSLTATVGCSLVPDSTETTYYRMTNDNGPVLTFDTYNNLLHYFSTPSSGEYEAKGGEFEFVISEISQDEIKLYGKKTRNTMYLRRLKSSPDEYAANTIHIYDHFVQGFTGTIGSAEVEATFGLSNKSITVVSGTDTLTAHFTYNDQGIRLYEPLRIGGHQVQTFSYDVEQQTFTCIDEGEDVVLQGVPFSDDKVQYGTYAGNYTLRYNNNSGAVLVSLVPNRMDGTYRLTGLSRHYSLVLQYDYDTGYLTLAPQVIGDYNGRTVYFTTYQYQTAGPWLSELASFTLKWNGNKNRVAYNFTATNPSRYNCDSGVLVMVYYDDSGTLTASTMSDPGWLVGSNAIIARITTLQRQKD